MGYTNPAINLIIFKVPIKRVDLKIKFFLKMWLKGNDYK